MNTERTFHFLDKQTWRKWLAKNYDKEKEAWLVLPKKTSGSQGISYEKAVEEALCFGWIDSIARRIDEKSYAQRFSRADQTQITLSLTEKDFGNSLDTAE